MRSGIRILVLGGLLASGGVVTTHALRETTPPPSFSSAGLRSLDDVAFHELPPVDVAALLAEDAAASGPGAVPRAGYPIKVDLSPAVAGTWEDLPDGDRLWRLRVRSPGALWIVLGFGTFRLQPGGELWVYPEQGGRTWGPYSSADIRRHGQLWFPPLAGDGVVVELHWPRSLDKQSPNLNLGTVSHGYVEWGGIGGTTPTPDSGSCNNDVNCPLGDDWQDEKRGVVNMLSGGSGYCTGSFIATTDQDCRNLVLTARHCVSTATKAAGTTFQFNFERPACNSGIAPTDQIQTGSTIVASYSASDFTLLELDEEPAEEFQVYYNGWSRATAGSVQSWGIHHPSNDEKAISYNADALVDGTNYGPDHWRITEWEDGTTEPGSSGSPIFDTDSRIVGQLHGGTASCTSITWDEYGKLDVSWGGGGTPASRLRDWLDPGNTGAIAQDGFDAAFCRVPQPRLDYAAHVVDDVAGNGDAVADPGESFTLELDQLNSGTLDATTVAGTLTSTTPGVVIADGFSDWPDIPLDGVRRSDPPHFSIEVPSDHPCGDPLDFQLDSTASESPGAWSSAFAVPVGTAQLNQAFGDDMESGIGGWTDETPVGDNPWGQTASDSNSPVTSWFVADISTKSDSVLLMPTQSGLPADSELRFWHRIDAENNYDGGVLEYTTDGGANWNDAGALITQGPYTGTISTGYESPLAGRSAWSGDNVVFEQVRVDLASLAGNDVQLRWRFATDISVADVGWWIDDVVLESTAWSCNPPVLLPGEASDPGGVGVAFTIDKDPGGFLLRWSAPPDGGAVDTYRLYRTDLAGAYTPLCETDLGSGTSTVLPTLPDGHGLLVVASNAAGEGPYGEDSDGALRDPAVEVCP